MTQAPSPLPLFFYLFIFIKVQSGMEKKEAKNWEMLN